MKILHVGKFFHPSHGGIESFLFDLAAASAEQGVEQGLIVHAQAGENLGTVDAPAYPFLRYFDRVGSLGSFGYAPISPAFGRRLNQAINRFVPDLLYLHFPNPSAFWALMTPAARRLPWIIHWHADASGPEFERLVRVLYRFYRPFEQAMLGRAARVIVSSPPYLDSSQALQRWHERCRVIPLGLDPRRVRDTADEAVSALWGSDGRLRILALGRLTAYKGFDVLLRALGSTQARLIIAGEGGERQRLEQLIRTHCPGAAVDLAGAVSDAHRNQLLSSCDLVCLPSLNRAEAFGISVLEAMAIGKPALVSKLPGSGLPWLVQDGLTGWHALPGDAEGLARRINWLDQHRCALSAAGEQACARFEQHFDIQQVARQIIMVQAEAVAASGSGGDSS